MSIIFVIFLTNSIVPSFILITVLNSKRFTDSDTREMISHSLGKLSKEFLSVIVHMEQTT